MDILKKTVATWSLKCFQIKPLYQNPFTRTEPEMISFLQPHQTEQNDNLVCFVEVLRTRLVPDTATVVGEIATLAAIGVADVQITAN